MFNTQVMSSNGRLCEMIAPAQHSIEEFIFPRLMMEKEYQQGWIALVKYAPMSLRERAALGHGNSFFLPVDFTHRLREQLISWISERLHFQNRFLCEQVKFQLLPDNWIFLYI